MSNDFWIPVSFNSELTEQKFAKAIDTCHLVHIFTVDALNNYFLALAEKYPYTLFRKELMVFIKEQKLVQHAQRYSLIRAAEKSFPYFSARCKLNSNSKFVKVNPQTADQYNEIQFLSRQVWYKYMALNSLITTAYGTISLEDEWPQILTDQAESQGIPFKTIPFLAHSATLSLNGDKAKIKFNLHSLNSKFGKRARQEMRQEIKKLYMEGEGQ